MKSGNTHTSRSVNQGGSFVSNQIRCVAGVICAIALSILFAGAAHAQAIPDKPQNVVAIYGGIKGGTQNGQSDGTSHVSWAHSANSDIDFYLIRWRSNNGTELRQYVCRFGDWPHWLANRCSYASGFDSNDRLSSSVDSASYSIVQINAVRQRTDGLSFVYSGYSDETEVSTGLPLNLQAHWDGSQYTVSWNQNPVNDDEALVRYALWTRSTTSSSNGAYRSATNNQTELTFNVPSNERGNRSEVRIRAEYQNLGATVTTEWMDIEDLSDERLIEDPKTEPLAGDLTDQCRPDGDPNVDNVYDRIGATGLYPEARIPLESHVWFIPTQDDGGPDPEFEGDPEITANFGHAHLLTCVPHAALGSIITNKMMNLDIEIQAHLQGAKKLDGTNLEPATDIEVRIDEIQIRGVNGSGAGDFLIENTPSFFGNPIVCGPGEACVFNRSVTFDLTTSTNGNQNNANRDQVFRSNGRKQLRISAVHNIYREGTNDLIAEMRGILRIPIILDIEELSDGVPHANNTYPGTESSGWLIQRPDPAAGGYTGIAVHRFGLNGNLETGMLPVAPISRNDLLTFYIRADAGSCVRLCGENEVQLDNLRAFINPTIHTMGHGHGSEVICPEQNNNDGCRAFDTVPLADTPRGNNQTYFVRRDIDISHLESGEHQIVFALEQPMMDSAEYPIEEEFLSTLTGLLIVRFIVTD